MTIPSYFFPFRAVCTRRWLSRERGITCTAQARTFDDLLYLYPRTGAWRLVALFLPFSIFFSLVLSLSLPPIPRAGPYCDHCLEGHACARANPCPGAQLRLTESEISIGIIAGARLFAPREREKRKHGEFELLKFTISPGHSLGARGLVKFHD